MNQERNFSKVTHSALETKEWAEKLAKHLKPGDVIALEGDLGAGKTTFTQGLAKGLGVSGVVNSPTFTIIKEYKGTLPLYHMDVYRIEDAWEELGLEEYFYGDGVTVVEWASLIQEGMPSAYLDIYIKRMEEDTRKLLLNPKGSRYIELCQEVLG